MKYELFRNWPDQHKFEIARHARKYSKKMNAPLIYCSTTANINVENIFQLIIDKAFGLKHELEEKHNATEDALIEFETVIDVE